MSQNDSTSSNVTKQSAVNDLLASVAETLKSSTTTVYNRLTQTLVERKLASRVDLLDKGLTKLTEARNEFKKIRPDQVSIGLDGAKN